MATTGKVKTLFSDKEKTEALFPRTKVSAVSDENGVGLNVLLDNINTEIDYITPESIGAAPAEHVKKTYFEIPVGEAASIAFSGTTNAMIYCRGWAGDVMGVFNYSGYSAGNIRQNLITLVNAGVIACGLNKDSAGQGLTIKNSHSTTNLSVCIDSGLQSSPPVITYTESNAAELYVEYPIPPMVEDKIYRTVERVNGVAVHKVRTSGGEVKYQLDGETVWHNYADLVGARPNTWMPTAANVGAAPASVSGTYSNCYYRNVGDEREWINPPMVLGTEYRTTERFNGYPVYVKAFTIGRVEKGTTSIEHNIANVRQPLDTKMYANSNVDITGSDLITNLNMERTKVNIVTTSAFGSCDLYLKYTKI